MRQLLNRFGAACIALIFFASPLWAADETELFHGHEAAGRQVLVKFRAATPETMVEAAHSMDVDIIEGVGRAGTHLLHSRSKNVATLVRELSARPDVAFVEPNFIVHAIAIPNDPRFGELWGLQNTGQLIGVFGILGADISAVPAWDISTGARTNVVAVVDTGIDYNHPDLAANVWSAPAAFTVSIGGRAITCAAGTHGFNAISNICDPMDDNNHGSHVSGTIGAAGNNALGVVGVNWTASIMGAKFLNAAGSGTIAGAINAIEFAVQAKAAFSATAGANVRVLSNSWGCSGCFSQALLDEINRANTADMLFVAAAGNSSSNNDLIPFYPASFNAPNVVAVAATDNTDALAAFSNFGLASVDLGAPGVNVLSTIIGGSYAYFSGTSMATPHVAGAAALVLSRCALNTAGLKSNLSTNVDLIPSLLNFTVTGGRLNANKAIQACSTPATPDFSLSATPASQTVGAGGSTSYTVTVTPSGGFTGTVTFSVSGLPVGASATFSPPSVTTSGSSTFTVTTSGTTSLGTSLLTITGTSGVLTHTTSVTLVVVQPSDFSLSATPASKTVGAGGSTSYTVTVTPSGGFTGTVTFSVSGLPVGASATFSPPSVTTSGRSKMAVTTSRTTSLGTSLLTITGTSGVLTHTTSVTLVVKR